MEITLKKLATLIIEHEHENTSYEIKETIISRRIQNLMNILTLKSNNPLHLYGCYFEDIETVDENQIFNYSAYLLYDLCGHSGDVNIVEISTLQEVEKILLGSGGLLNMFTTDMFVIQNNKIKPFELNKNKIKWK